MRIHWITGLALCGVLLSAGQQSVRAQSTEVLSPVLSPAVTSAMGVDSLLKQLSILQQEKQGTSAAVVALQQRILERVLRASFNIDSVLGRIDTEASYADEDSHLLQARAQRESSLLNLATFAASGALGAAGSAMQLTRDLNHAGTALSAAAGGTALVLTAVQLKSGGGKQTNRSPYNMLAEVLGKTPNAESTYPPLIVAYLQSPSPDGRAPLAERLTAAWRRLHRLQQGSKGAGASIESVTADRSSGLKLTADELADREAMLHDLHANIILLRTELEKVLALSETAGD